MKPKKIKTTINMPDHLLKEIQDHMYKEGYNLRQKSVWICEALKRFLHKKKNTNLVIAATQIQKKTKNMTLYMNEDLSKKLNTTAKAIASKHPTLDGVKSLIVRASIINRLWIYDEKNI